MSFNSRVSCQKNRHVVDGHIVDASLKKADKAMVKFGNFDPFINGQMISVSSLGMVICQGARDSLILFTAEG